jgi:hypothetical protein
MLFFWGLWDFVGRRGDEDLSTFTAVKMPKWLCQLLVEVD